MAFHVTQCPHCESTFNTNANILAAASGRVRCGSCLRIFDAIEQILPSEETDPDEELESVFIGNYPADYFNPQSFLTRSKTNPSADLVDQAIKPSFPSRAALFSKIRTAATQPLEDSPSRSHDQHTQLAAATTTLSSQDSNETSATDHQIENDSTNSLEAEGIRQAESIPDPSTDANAVDSASSPSSAIELPMQSTPESPLDSESTNSPLEEDTYIQPEIITEEEFNAAISAETTGDVGIDNGSAIAAEESGAPQEKSKSDAVYGHIRPEDVKLSASFSLFHVPVSKPETKASQELSEEHEDNAQPPAIDSKGVAEETQDTQSPQSETEQVSPDLSESSSLGETDYQEHSHPVPVVADFTTANDDDYLYFEDEIVELEQVLEDATDEEFIELFEIEDDPDNKPIPLEASDADNEPAELIDLNGDSPPDALTVTRIQPMEASVTTDSAVSSLTEDEVSTETIRARALNADLKDDDALEKIETADLDTLSKFVAPLELISGSQRKWAGFVATTCLATLLLATLAGQYFWRYLPLYSQTDALRGYYLIACQWLDCQLPPYSNISAIRSDELVVRSHPTEENALAVAVAFRNSAPYAQAFPVMILSFNSASNDVVALREFAAEEYLPPALRRFKEMPSNTPVQVELNIMDPGPFAVNYTLAFRRP